ncbi:MAG: protein kinase, partial [Myxococcales bacterium]|nr:protein kinase [Myxococcales bacterium]
MSSSGQPQDEGGGDDAETGAQAAAGLHTLPDLDRPVLPRLPDQPAAAPDPKSAVEPTAPSPAPDEPLGTAATLASGGVGPSSALGPPVVSVNIFPAPHWDKYEFISLLGRGGMGAVYKARDRRLGRIVALKFIHGDDPGLIQRFQQEARAQARLQSPNICQVHEVGFVDGKPYIAMEYVEGAALDKAARSLSLTEKVTLTRDIALAMHIAHEEGIVHRD